MHALSQSLFGVLPCSFPVHLPLPPESSPFYMLFVPFFGQMHGERSAAPRPCHSERNAAPRPCHRQRTQRRSATVSQRTQRRSATVSQPSRPFQPSPVMMGVDEPSPVMMRVEDAWAEEYHLASLDQMAEDVFRMAVQKSRIHLCRKCCRVVRPWEPMSDRGR